MKNITRFILICAAGLSFSGFTGTQLLMQEYKNGKATGQTVVISVEGKMMRMDHKGEAVLQEISQMIFNTEKKEMLIIDHKSKSFSRMDKAFFNEMRERMEQVKKQMDAQLANMPPAQQEMMRGMMEKAMGGAVEQSKKKTTEFIKSTRTDSAAGYDCKTTEYFVDGNKKREFCIIPVDKIKGAKMVFDAMKDMSVMFADLFQSLEKVMPEIADSNPFQEMENLDGFPLIITEFEDDNTQIRNQLDAIESKSFTKDFFLLPAGYKEKKMGMEDHQ